MNAAVNIAVKALIDPDFTGARILILTDKTVIPDPKSYKGSSIIECGEDHKLICDLEKKLTLKSKKKKFICSEFHHQPL
ncbi:MAG: hypothetical protein LBE38_06825 [Deltaproteobacteria bacterium]|nr:hypothetical protein [Deltaproteobacteria bacterium]